MPTSGRGIGRPKKSNCGSSTVRQDPRSEDFFSSDEREGGPIDPLSNFAEVYESIFYLTKPKIGCKQQKIFKFEDKHIYSSMEGYELYKYLKQFSTTFNKGTNVGSYLYQNHNHEKNLWESKIAAPVGDRQDYEGGEKDASKAFSQDSILEVDSKEPSRKIKTKNTAQNVSELHF